MADYLLDTTVLIQQFRGRPRVRQWIESALARGDTMATTPVNVAEAFAGAHAAERPYWDALLRELTIYPVYGEDGVRAGSLRYDLARRGIVLHTPDALIAAIAANRQLPLVTANVKDFQNAGIDLLALDGDA